MTSDQIKAVMIFQLAAYNPAENGVTLNDESIHKDFLKGQGMGGSTSAEKYRTAILWTIKTELNRTKNKAKIKFPPNWLDMSVAHLAENLITQAAASTSKTQKAKS